MYQLIDPAEIVAELRLIRQLLERQRPGGSAADRAPDAPWSLAAAAKHLGVCSRHLARCCDKGEIASFRIGKRRLIPAAEVKRVSVEGISPKAK